jgi:hypothetical protein
MNASDKEQPPEETAGQIQAGAEAEMKMTNLWPRRVHHAGANKFEVMTWRA